MSHSGVPVTIKAVLFSLWNLQHICHRLCCLGCLKSILWTSMLLIMIKFFLLEALPQGTWWLWKLVSREITEFKGKTELTTVTRSKKLWAVVLRIYARIRLPVRKGCFSYKDMRFYLKDRDCEAHSSLLSHCFPLLLCIQVPLLCSLNLHHAAMPGM